MGHANLLPECRDSQGDCFPLSGVLAEDKAPNPHSVSSLTAVTQTPPATRGLSSDLCCCTPPKRTHPIPTEKHLYKSQHLTTTPDS